MKKGMVLLAMMILLILVGSQALAVSRWYLGGYGKYNFSSNGLNQLVKSFNSWTQNILGITDFRIKELQAITIYSISGTWVISPHWEVELATIALTPIPIILSESKERTVPLGEGAQKTLKAESKMNYGMFLYDLMGRYFFSSSSKLTPFVEAGLTYVIQSGSGYYLASEEVYTPPSNYEYRRLNQRFSFQASQLAYVLGAGVQTSLGKYFRVGLEAKIHWVPPMNLQPDLDNEGFSSPPLGPELEINSSGMSYGLYLMFGF